MRLTKEQRAALLFAYFTHLRDVAPDDFSPEALSRVSCYDDSEVLDLLRGVEDESAACARALEEVLRPSLTAKDVR